MDTNENFASEWQSLREKRAELVRETARLREELVFLTKEPTMQVLLRERKQMEKELSDLAATTRMYREDIESRRQGLIQRRRAVTLRPFAGNLKRPHGPLEPIRMVEKRFEKLDIDDQLKLEINRQAATRMSARIAEIDKHYGDSKNCLKRAIREEERKIESCSLEGIEWGSQDRAHLEWVLAHESSYKEKVVHRYRARFPEDKLRDLFPVNSRPVSGTLKTSSVRERRPINAEPVATEVLATSLVDWKFSVGFISGSQDYELPPIKEQFLEHLQPLLDDAGYPALTASVVYDKLVTISKMKVEQRLRLKKLIRYEDVGKRKIIRIGKIRLFLKIDEEQRRICFTPLRREKAYTQS